MDHTALKEKLETEKNRLIAELETVGRKNPSHTSDWEGKETELNTDTAEETEVADALENYNENNALLHELETRLTEVTNALAKMDAGTYGVCEIGGEQIEEDRLMANPAATTCKQHM